MNYQAWLGTLFNLLPSSSLMSALFHIPFMPSWHGATIFWKHHLFLSSTVLMFLIIVMCSTMGLTYSQAYQLCTQLPVVFPVDQWNQTSPWLFHLGLETLHGRTDVALVLEHNTFLLEASTVNNFRIWYETLLCRVTITYLVTERENMKFSEKFNTGKFMLMQIMRRNGSGYCIIIYL